MAIDEISVVERPTGGFSSFSSLLRGTLENGRAISVPIKENETYAVARNRAAANGQRVARGVDASLRTRASGDGHAVLMWLEQKSQALKRA